jgi:KAP family P-loop domain
VWVPVIGAWMARFGSLAKLAERHAKEKQETSALSQRTEVIKALAKVDRRVLVIVDDLDRIEPEQIRDVVRLIKLVGDFPNATYLLAYDSDKVARALGEDAATGREYLEKIVQVTHDLPAINDWALVQILQTELDVAIQAIEHGPFSEADWANIFHTGMRPFFETVRDVRRYLNSVPVSLRVVGDEVALVDALALETLRIFAPAAYAKLPTLVSILTAEGVPAMGGLGQGREEADRQAINDLVAAAAPHEEATRELLRRLFPKVGRHLGGTAIYGDDQAYEIKRRVANPDVLRIYLRRTLPEGTIPARLVAEA